MNKRKKLKCPHPQCDNGFIYTFRDLTNDADKTSTALPATEVTRMLCPVCKGLAQVRRKR